MPYSPRGWIATRRAAQDVGPPHLPAPLTEGHYKLTRNRGAAAAVVPLSRSGADAGRCKRLHGFDLTRRRMPALATKLVMPAAVAALLTMLPVKFDSPYSFSSNCPSLRCGRWGR